MDIRIRTIPHSEQRYPTTGDWIFVETAPNTEHLSVLVSAMPDWRYEALVGVHEMIEALLCKFSSTPEEDVSRFDMLYESVRTALETNNEKGYAGYRQTLESEFACTCTITSTSEPGDDYHAPYYRQHQLATSVERMLAAELAVIWTKYEDANLALYEA